MVEEGQALRASAVHGQTIKLRIVARYDSVTACFLSLTSKPMSLLSFLEIRRLFLYASSCGPKIMEVGRAQREDSGGTSTHEEWYRHAVGHRASVGSGI